MTERSYCPDCRQPLLDEDRCDTCGWRRVIAVPPPIRRPAIEAKAVEHVDPAAVAKLKAHLRAGLGKGTQRRSILRPDESYPDFLQALKNSGLSREAFERERLAANGWSAEDEQAFQDRLRDLQLSYRYQRTGGHKA